MQKDYYETLHLKRTCTPQQISQNYKKLSLKYYPSISTSQSASHNFSQIAQAYDVLNDPIKKAYYDKHGWRMLTHQLYAEGGLKGGYRFNGDALGVFQRFYKQSGGVDLAVGTKGSVFGQGFGGIDYQDEGKEGDLKVQVQCTLEQLYRGTIKNVQYSKKVLSLDGNTLTNKSFTKQIQIRPGFHNNQILRFPSEGNETISRNPSDLVFVVKQLKHKNYTRQGDNLIYNYQVTLVDALSCSPVQIYTLEGKKLRVSLDEIPSPQKIKEIQGEGMPITGEGKKKGDLYIRFDIQFPKTLPEDVKKELRQLLA